MLETPADVSTLLLDQADRLFAQHLTREHLATSDRGEWLGAVWDAVEAAGLPLALLPEDRGGFGVRPADALLLVRRAAYHTLPAPLGETMMAAALWADAGGEVPGGALSLAPGDGIALRRGPHGYALDGTVSRVPWGSQVDRVLLHARDVAGTACLVLAPCEATEVRPGRNVAFEPRDTLTWRDATLPESLVRPAPPSCAEGLLLFGALLRAQQMVGAMERCLDHALAYANERRQFGRAIGKFQAVQHMLAEAAGHYAAAAAAADLAAEAWGRPGFAFATALAKARAGEAAGKVAETAHQVHGAMGFTQEHPLHFSTRRLWSWRDEFGHEPYWQERIGRLVCTGGGEALWLTLVEATAS